MSATAGESSMLYSRSMEKARCVVWLSVILLSACPDAGAHKNPPTHCTKAYEKCVLSSGVLGVCNPVECTGDMPEPCLVCRSQH
jgi:hypothetical protein